MKLSRKAFVYQSNDSLPVLQILEGILKRESIHIMCQLVLKDYFVE